MKTKKVTTKTKVDKIRVEYIDLVYVGVSELAKRIGYVTGKEYSFTKDQFQTPQKTRVDKRDIPALLQERGRGCFRRDPEAIFILKSDWDNNC